MTSLIRFSSILTFGLLVVGAVVMSKQRVAATKMVAGECEDQSVEDFTPVQQAVLARVSEIWAECRKSEP
jgi:hypothetical protein